ncbi:mitogen-activated protein kinase kinase kinase 20-like [Corylus avellana]|uniref:mitogen-activated protein kinase kinase kinase 20-like n=1 Tax=Corylus avellana TaxID=13451 RepID=UPI00286AC1F0|nr:mitogen-activated protein kinase kinase kinase 20-like [Corylus avellana]XP_059442022.1 mitogen-activated protein kinase kinase kinase 20-like [Corylus avellana]
MKWFKMKVLGRGSYGTVHLAMATTNTTGSSSSGFIAVKSAVIEKSFSLMKEAEILQEFVNCPEVVRGLGFDISYEGGLWFYNLLLEYASGGTLHDLIQTSGGKLDEIDVKKYTRMILKGLRCIHEKGYVHCDLKPENILVFSSPHGARSKSVKITDFGLSKIPGDLNELMTKRYDFRGTPLYMSPESFLVGEIKGCLDIWSLGCVVVEMISGKPVWDSTGSLDGLVIQIATESPNIPETMSEIGKDFLRRCFAWDPTERWTAEMLLHHPFLLETQALPPSTKTALDFSVSKKLPPPPGFEPIAKRPSLPKTLPPPPPGFGPIAKRPSLPKTLPPTPPGFESIRKNLPPPPGFSSRRILA